MDNSELLIREMLSRADMRLQAQQTIAIAADARAMQFAAICVAGAALIVAVGGQSMALPHYVVAGTLAVAAGCAGWTARPLAWHSPGMRPSAFADDIARAVPITEVQRELCDHLETSISANNEILDENAALLRFAAAAAIMAPILGAVASFI